MHRSFASSSVPAHLLRGGLGFGLLIGSVVSLRAVGAAALLPAAAGLAVLRGCPMCWAIGLLETISRGRLERACDGGTCRAARPPAPEGRAPVSRQGPAGEPGAPGTGGPGGPGGLVMSVRTGAKRQEPDDTR
jgi:hypothetical protein